MANLWRQQPSGRIPTECIIQHSHDDNQHLIIDDFWELLSSINNLYVNVAGTWKQATGLYVNVAGTWKQATGLYVNVAGTWKQIV
jgi:hypothetical protein